MAVKIGLVRTIKEPSIIIAKIKVYFVFLKIAKILGMIGKE